MRLKQPQRKWTCGTKSRQLLPKIFSFLLLLLAGFSLVRIEISTPELLTREVQVLLPTQTIIGVDNVADTTATTDVREESVLWMTSCETRNIKNAIPWFDTAQPFQHESARVQNETLVEVRVVNICEGAKWYGLTTKLICMEQFLQTNIFNSTDPTTASKKKKHYVLFSDSDVLLNAWAFPNASTVLERYHEIVSPGNHSLIISAEPNCWFGKLCSENDFRLVYPTTTRTSCPAFVNSGLYMGEGPAIMDMLQVVLGKTKNPQFESIIQSIAREKPVKAKNDQTMVSVWYSINRDKAILDSQASLFRNLYFGMVNHTQIEGRNSCGLDGVASCGWYLPAYVGHVDQTTLEMVMDPVPSCPTHPKPLFIHGNGGSKGAMKNLFWARKAAMKALNK